MKATDNPLLRHLVLAVVLKLVVLAVLWWVFVREERVSVDVDRAADHLGTAAEATVSPQATSGAQP